MSSGVGGDLWDIRSITTETDATTVYDEPSADEDPELVAAEQRPTFWNDLKPEVDKALRDLNIGRRVDLKELRELHAELPDGDRQRSLNLRDLAFRIAAMMAVPGGRLGLPGGARQDADESVLGSDDDLFGDNGGSALGSDDDLFGESVEGNSALPLVAHGRLAEVRAAEGGAAGPEATHGGTRISFPRPAVPHSTAVQPEGADARSTGVVQEGDAEADQWAAPGIEESWRPPAGWADRQGLEQWWGWATPGRRGTLFRVPFAAYLVRELFAELRLPGGPVRTLAEVGELLGDRTGGALPGEAVLEELQARFVAEEVERVVAGLEDPHEQRMLDLALRHFRSTGSLDLSVDGVLVGTGERTAELGRWLKTVGAGLVAVSPDLASALARMGRHTGSEEVAGHRDRTVPDPHRAGQPPTAGRVPHSTAQGHAQATGEGYRAPAEADPPESSSAPDRAEGVRMTAQLGTEGLAVYHTAETWGTPLPARQVVVLADGRQLPLGGWIHSVRNGFTAVKREELRSLLEAGMQPSENVVIREDIVQLTPDIAFPLVEEYYRANPLVKMHRSHLGQVPSGVSGQGAGTVRLGLWLDNILRGVAGVYEGDLEDLRRAGVVLGDRVRTKPGSGQTVFGGRGVPPRMAVRLLAGLYRSGALAGGQLPARDLVVEDPEDRTAWHLGEWAHSVGAGDTRIHAYLYRELVSVGMPLEGTAPLRDLTPKKITADSAPDLVRRWFDQNPGSVAVPAIAVVDGHNIGMWLHNLRKRKSPVTREQYRALVGAGARIARLDAEYPDAASGFAVPAPKKKITVDSAPDLVRRWFDQNPGSLVVPAIAVVDEQHIGTWLRNLGKGKSPVTREQYRALVGAGARIAWLDAEYPDVAASGPAAVRVPKKRITLESAPDLVRRWFDANPGRTVLPTTAVVEGRNIGLWLHSFEKRHTPVTREQYRALVEAGGRVPRLDDQYPDVAASRPGGRPNGVRAHEWPSAQGGAGLPAPADGDGVSHARRPVTPPTPRAEAHRASRESAAGRERVPRAEVVDEADVRGESPGRPGAVPVTGGGEQYEVLLDPGVPNLPRSGGEHGAGPVNAQQAPPPSEAPRGKRRAAPGTGSGPRKRTRAAAAETSAIGPADGLDVSAPPPGPADGTSGSGRDHVPGADRTSGDLGDPNALPPEQIQWLHEQGIVPVATPPDGDCFYHALGRGDPAFLRQTIGVLLRHDLDSPGARVYFDAGLDAYLHAQYPDAAFITDDHRREFIAAFETPGSWAHTAGDATPSLVARVLNLRLHVHRPGNRTTMVIEPSPLPAGVVDIHLVYAPDRNHWLAAAPLPGQERLALQRPGPADTGEGGFEDLAWLSELLADPGMLPPPDPTPDLAWMDDLIGSIQSPLEPQAPPEPPVPWGDLKAEVDQALRDLGINRTVEAPEIQELYRALPEEDRRLAVNSRALAFRIAAGIADPDGLLRMRGGARQAASSSAGSGAAAPAVASDGATGRTSAQREPAAARPGLLDTAEARRLATEAVAAEAADRDIRDAHGLIDRVTSWFGDAVRQAQATSPFTPTADLARLFVGLDPQLIGSVGHEALPYLAGQPDLVARISTSLRVRVAVLTQPGFAQFLGSRPNLLNGLLSARTTGRLTDHAVHLMRYPEVAKALETDAELRGLVLERMIMINELGGKLPLIRVVAKQRWLQNAITQVPQVAEALRSSNAPMAAIRPLKENLDLLLAITHHPRAFPDADAVRTFLEHTHLLRAMHRNPQQADTVFRIPGLLDAVRRDPGLMDVLGQDEALSDVLADLGESARRLAESSRLLRAAYGNPRLAEALSYDPNLLDAGLGDDELERLLRTATGVTAAEPAIPRTGARPVQRLLADPKVRAAVRGDNELGKVLLSSPHLVSVLLDHPDLLGVPHEYRRLLRPANAALREQITPGSPLVAPGLLRTVLRSPGGVYESLLDRFSEPGTAVAGPEDPKRVYAASLAHSAEVRAVAQADPGARQMLLHQPRLAELLDHVVGLGEAIRREGRLLYLIDRDPFLPLLLKDSPEALPALLANDSALLGLALAARHTVAALREDPELIGDVAAHPYLLRALTHENDVTPSTHWRRLFEDADLLDVLGGGDGLVLARVLALAPDVLTDALARDAFIEEVKQPSGLEKYVELSRRTRELAREVQATDDPDITRSGIEVDVRLARVARAILDVPALARRTIVQEAAPEYRAYYQRAADAVLVALREIPKLRGAIDREFGIVLGMLSNDELVPLLLKRPGLVEQLADHTSGALKAVHGNPVLTRGLRENGKLYLRFTTDKFLVQALAGSSFAGFAQSVGRNRRYLQAFDAGLPNIRANEGDLLLQASEVVSAAVVDDAEVRAELAARPGLIHRLKDLFYGGPEGTLLTGADWEAVEAGARAVVADPAVLRVVDGHPELLDVLVGRPALARVLAENPGAVATEAEIVGLLRNERLLEAIEAAPEQAAAVGAAGLLPVVMRTPELLGAVAGSEHLSGLLGRADVRGLLGERPGVAEDLVRVPELVDALGGLPGLVEAVRLKPALAGLLRRNPGLLGVLRARRSLVDELARDTDLWRATVRVPALVEALSQSARVLRHLRRRPGLVGVLASGSVRVAVSAPQLLAVLSDETLTAMLDGQPALAATLLGSSDLAGRAVADAGFVEAVRGMSRERGMFEGLLREPVRLLGELDRRGAASRRDARRKPAAAAAGASRPEAVPATARRAPDTEAQAVVRRMPALGALQRGHREVLVALARDEEVLGLLDEDGLLLRRVVESPELAALVAAFPDLVDELRSPVRAEEFRFDVFLGRTSPAWDFERDFAAYEDHLGALDVVVHGESRAWVRNAVETAWRVAEPAHREAVAAERREREDRLGRFRVHQPDTWEHSGDVHYANGLHEESLSAPRRRVLAALAEGSGRPRERVFGANQAVHAHLDGGSGGVSFAYVLGGDGRVGLLAYGLSTSRQGNDYRWDGNGGTYVSGPLPLEAVEDAPALLASQDLVAQADTRRAGTTNSGRRKKGDPGAVRGVPDAEPGAGALPVVDPAADGLLERPGPIEPSDADALVVELSGLPTAELWGRLELLPAGTRLWLASDAGFVEGVREMLTEREFAQVAARLLVVVPEGVERPASARQEAYAQVALMLLDGEVAAGLLRNGAVVMVLPKDVPVTRFSPFAHVTGLRDGSGRPFEELRGAADGALTAAVTEENLLGETTSVGPAPHMADGYSSVTHELAHLVHDRLGQEDRDLIAGVWAAKRARGGGEQWPDGVRLDLYGRAADNYSSTSADEYFAQLGNAYLGTNHGTDAATGRPRNNGPAYVRTFERELLPLLERLYGTDPDAEHRSPANPVTATTADDAVYEAFRQAMALTGQAAPPEEQRNAGPAEAGPDADSTADRVRSSAVVSGTSVLGRDFTGRWSAPWTAGMPPVQQLLLDPEEQRPLPIGGPGGVPWQSGYLVHAELAPGTFDRIHTVDARSGTGRPLTFAEFAQLVARDSALAETGPHVPVVLLVPGALSRGLALLRAVRDAVDRPVWGHTGRALLFEEAPGAPLSIGVLREAGRLTGQWLTLPEVSAGAELEPPGEITSVDGETFDDADVILRPFAAPDGRPAGHWSKAQEYNGGGERRFYGAVTARESARYIRTPKKKYIETDAAGPVAWSGMSPYFLNAHGRIGAAVLALSDGRTAAFSGEQVGGLLRRRRSFTELFSHRPIVTLVCWAAAHSNVRNTTFIKELADTSGHMVFGATSRVARTPSYSMGIADDEHAAARGEWRVALPASRAEPFDRMVHDSGLVPAARAVRADDRMWMLQVLRMEQDLHGPDAGSWRSARQLAALVRLHRDALPERERLRPLTRNFLEDLVRSGYGWDPSATVISGDITHLLELVEVYRPRTLRELYEVGRAHPPVSMLNPLPYDYASGQSLPYGEIDHGGTWFASGTRGAPPAQQAAPQVRSATISLRTPGAAAVGREFTDTWDGPFMTAWPQRYHRLEQSDGRPGGPGYAPTGEQVPLPHGAAGRSYVVHALTASADADRIWAAEAGSGEVGALSFAGFARVVASDPRLADLPADVPILLLVPGAAATGLGLLRAVRDVTGRPVWGHTGQAVLFEEGPGEQLGIGVVRQAGRVEGQWVFLPLAPAAAQPLPPGQITSVRGRVFDDADLVLRPFADPEGRIAGHWSFEDPEFVSSFEDKTYPAVRTTRFDHIAVGEDNRGRPTGSDEVPWARQSLSPYFLHAHGAPGEIELRTRAGHGVRFSGEQVGGLLRRRRSFTELFHGHPVVALACRAAVPPGTPSATTSFVQDLANGSGHTAFGAPDRLGFDNRAPWLAIPDDEVTGEPRTWKVAFPEPQGPYLDWLVHDSGLLPAGQPVTEDDRSWMLQALRTDLDLHGLGARNRTLRALAALLRLHRAAPRGQRRRPEPFNRDRVVEMARAAFGWDVSRKVSDGDIAHLLSLLDQHRPSDVGQLAVAGRAVPPADTDAGAAAGPSPTGVRGAPPAPAGPQSEMAADPARHATGVRDFTGRREMLRAGAPGRSFHLVRPSDDERSEYRAVGGPRGLPWRSGPSPYVVHARPAPGDPGRIEVIDGGADGVRYLTFTEFARLIASDAGLARAHPDVPVVLLVAGAATTGLGLLRAVRDAVGRPVWGHTGRAVLYQEAPGRPPEIGVRIEDHRVTGQWILLPRTPEGTAPEPPGEIVAVDGEVFEDDEVILRPFADATGGLAGHWSEGEREFADADETLHYRGVRAARFGHVTEQPDGRAAVTGTDPLPWAGQHPAPYFLAATGGPGQTELLTADGRKVAFSGEELGRLLRRRPSFAELAHGRSVVTLGSWGAAPTDAAVPAATFVQDLANTSGHPVFGPTSWAALVPEDPWMVVGDDARTGAPNTWKGALPEPRGDALDELVRDVGLLPAGQRVGDDDRRRMVQVLRTDLELHGTAARDPRTVRALASLARLHRALPQDAPEAGLPFDRTLLQHIARAVFGWNATIPVTGSHLAQLLRIVDAHAPRDFGALAAAARRQPPAALPDSAGTAESDAALWDHFDRSPMAPLVVAFAPGSADVDAAPLRPVFDGIAAELVAWRRWGDGRFPLIEVSGWGPGQVGAERAAALERALLARLTEMLGPEARSGVPLGRLVRTYANGLSEPPADLHRDEEWWRRRDLAVVRVHRLFVPLDAPEEDLARIRYLRAADEYERRLARYLIHHPQAVRAVRTVAAAAWNVVEAEAPERLSRFGSARPSSIGSVGEDVLALERVAVQGNIREQVYFLFNAAANDVFEGTNVKAELGGFSALIAAERSQRQERHASPTLVPEDVITPPLSEDEKAFLVSSAGWKDGEPVAWTNIADHLSIRMDDAFQRDSKTTSGLVLSGTSGSAYHLMNSARALETTVGAEVDMQWFGLALVGTFVHQGYHTAHEVLRSLAMWDEEQGDGLYGLDYEDGPRRYRSLPGLTERELRAHVAVDGLFPDEHAEPAVGSVEELADAVERTSPGFLAREGVTDLAAVRTWIARRLETADAPAGLEVLSPDRVSGVPELEAAGIALSIELRTRATLLGGVRVSSLTPVDRLRLALYAESWHPAVGRAAVAATTRALGTWLRLDR
ncbi:hypothetical protein ACWCPT_34920 [Streptomyces sp. NPDC002308]